MLKRALLLLICLTVALPALAAQEFRIADIIVKGNKRVQASDVLHAIKIKPGQTVTTADIDGAIADIYRMDRFSDITAEISSEAGEKILTFKVVERPLVRNILFEGNDELSTEKLREALTIHIPEMYDPLEVAKSVEMIKAQYVKEGYYNAEVTEKTDINAENEALVTFHIKEGDLVRIKDIRFEGNTVFDAGELQDAMETKKKWIFSWITGRGNYDKELLDQDLQRIASLYYNKGYIRVKVREPVISLVDDNQNLLLLIRIDEGPQYTVGTIDAKGDLLKPKEELLAMVDLKPGEIFSRGKMRDGVNKLTDLYADQGYAYANVTPLTRSDDVKHIVSVLLDIEQGPLVTVERINITGNSKTRDKVIRREMKLVEGDLFNATNLKKSKQRINNLGFFEAVNVSTSEGSAKDLMDVEVNVKERATGTFSIGGGYSSMDGFVAQGSITQENFLGRALRLNLAASLGGKSTTYTLGVTDPYFLDTRWTLGLELYRTDREWEDFSRKATGFAVKAGHPIGEYSRLLVTYRLEKKDIYDISSTASSSIRDEEGSSTLSSVTTLYSYNTTDNRLDPSLGTDLQASWEFAGLGGTEKFSKYILDVRHFWPWKWGSSFSVRSQVGFVHSLTSDDVPLDERFYLGGIYTIRGFESREVGPRDKNGDFTGGNTETFFNFEYIFPLYKELNLKGVAFFDVGNTWGDDYFGKDDTVFASWRYSTGLGVRWLSPLGPLRFEYGINLDPRDYESRGKFDFMIGRFF